MPLCPCVFSFRERRSWKKFPGDNFLIVINALFFFLQVTQCNSSFYETQLPSRYLLSTYYFASAICDAQMPGTVSDNGSTFTSLECKKLVHETFYLSPLCKVQLVLPSRRLLEEVSNQTRQVGSAGSLIRHQKDIFSSPHP